MRRVRRSVVLSGPMRESHLRTRSGLEIRKVFLEYRTVEASVWNFLHVRRMEAARERSRGCLRCGVMCGLGGKMYSYMRTRSSGGRERREGWGSGESMVRRSTCVCAVGQQGL